MATSVSGDPARRRRVFNSGDPAWRRRAVSLRRSGKETKGMNSAWLLVNLSQAELENLGVLDLSLMVVSL